MSCGDILWPVQAYDHTGAWIRWERRNYEAHCRKRKATEQWHSAIGQTLADADIVLEHTGGGYGYYRRGVLPANRDLYLCVVVYWTGALGNIATAFATDRVKKFTRIVRLEK